LPTIPVHVVIDPNARLGDLVGALASLLLDRARREVAEQRKQQKLVVTK
jgi:hypothetical protein